MDSIPNDYGSFYLFIKIIVVCTRSGRRTCYDQCIDGFEENGFEETVNTLIVCSLKLETEILLS